MANVVLAIYCIVILIGCVLLWHIFKHRELLRVQSVVNDQLMSRLAELEKRNLSFDSWAGSFSEFSGDMNKRLVSLETDNKDLTAKPPRDDEDPFTGSRSWTAQAAAAERGAGVRLSA